MPYNGPVAPPVAGQHWTPGAGVPSRKRESFDPELGKQLFGNVLESLRTRQTVKPGDALDILIGGAPAPFDTAAVAAPEAVAPPMAAAPPAVRAALDLPDGEVLYVQAERALIGRKAGKRAAAPEVDLSDYDPLQSVSRRHAWLELDGQGYLVRVESDPAPTNPVLVNGEPIEPGDACRLETGAVLQVGLVELRYRCPAD
jgi:hypothetical protein